MTSRQMVHGHNQEYAILAPHIPLFLRDIKGAALAWFLLRNCLGVRLLALLFAGIQVIVNKL